MTTHPPESTSRYELLEKVASGGMATVYVGRQRGAEGFWRLVAIKRPHQHLLDDQTFRRMFVEEARLASRIHHPHVVPVLDVEERPGGQLILVMDYVEGASLAELMDAVSERGGVLPVRVAVRIALDALAGLHAAHELTDAGGRPLKLVHRDVSPHNVLVGVDGTSRVADFGIAKSVVSKGVTESGVLKGKLAYMAPEYVERQLCDARSDVFAMAVVAWEAIAGRRLFKGESDYDTLRKIVDEPAPALSSVATWVGPSLDAILANALERDAERRTPSARVLADALEAAARRDDLVATIGEVADFLKAAMATPLAVRRERLRRFLDAGGTTGAMEAAPSPEGPTARMPDNAAGAADAAAFAATQPVETSTPPPAASTPEEEPPSRAVTSVGGGDVTDRALVAAGLRPRKRSSSSGLLIGGVLAVVAGGASAAWVFRGTASGPLPPSSVAPPVPGAVGPMPSTAAAPEPAVAPIGSAPVASPTSSASAAASTPSLPVRPPVRPAVRPDPPPPPPPTGPIRENPYR